MFMTRRASYSSWELLVVVGVGVEDRRAARGNGTKTQDIVQKVVAVALKRKRKIMQSVQRDLLSQILQHNPITSDSLSHLFLWSSAFILYAQVCFTCPCSYHSVPF